MKIPQGKKFFAFSPLTDGFEFDGSPLILLQFFDVFLSIRPVALQSFFLAFAADPDVDDIGYLYDIDASAV